MYDMLKKLFLIIPVLLQILPQQMYSQSTELKVMSYNIRQGSADDGDNSWIFRSSSTLEMLEDQMPDVFGVQEALGYQVEYISEHSIAYDYVGVGRDDGNQKGEYMAIFWSKKTMSVLEWGTFWLSETPDVPSKGWDAACYRTATWALMEVKKTGQKFYFVNTHLDHIGVDARREGLNLIVDKIASINHEGLPMVLTGDFNMIPSAPELKELDAKMNSTRLVAIESDNHNTFNGWGKGTKDQIIDYIYISGFSSCLEYHTVTDEYAQRKYISDHYPIVSRLIF